MEGDAHKAATGFMRIQGLQTLRSKAVAGDWAIGDALVLARDLKCTDARDHVYGILGLVQEEDRMPIDYAIDTARLFSQASWYFYLTRNSLSWLDQCGIENDSRTPGLPSWAVDWGNRATLGFQFYKSFDQGDCSPHWKYVYGNWNTGTLHVTASPVDRVKFVLDRVYEPGWNPANNLDVVHSWIDQLHDLGIVTSREENREMPFSGRGPTFAFLSTIFRDTIVYYDNDGKICLRRLNDEDLSNAVGWYMELNWVCEEQIRTYSPELSSLPHAIAFRDQLRDSTMCLTEDGRMAMVPLSVREGDVMWHVRSCSAPLILRRVSNGDPLRVVAEQVTRDIGFVDYIETYQIVGPCYAAGLMGSGGDWPDSECSICLV